MKLAKSTLALIIVLLAFSSFAQPSIEIMNPQDGTTVGTGLNPFWTISQAPDFAVFKVELYINGNLVRDYQFQTQDFFNDVFVTHYWRTHGKGTYLLEARVIDWSGDEAWASPVTVFRP